MKSPEKLARGRKNTQNYRTRLRETNKITKALAFCAANFGPVGYHSSLDIEYTKFWPLSEFKEEKK